MTIVAGKVFDGAPGGIPFVAVERVGGIPRVAQFWIVKYVEDFDKTDRQPVTRIAAYGPRDQFLGSIGLTKRTETTLLPDRRLKEHLACMADLKAVAVETGVRSDVVMRVENAALVARARNKGIGIGLYTAAAVVARRTGLAIMADACFGSHTSDEAMRVWGSRRLREKLVVHGLVGALRGPRPSLAVGSSKTKPQRIGPRDDALSRVSEQDLHDALEHAADMFEPTGISAVVAWIERGAIPTSNPIVIIDAGRRGTVIGDGRGRINVAIGMGWKTVPAVVVKVQ